jgi:hypothetical protein
MPLLGGGRGAAWLAPMLAAFAAFAGSAAGGDAGTRAEFQGAISLPDQVPDADGKPVAVTGLSGITWLGNDTYAAVMDNSRFVLLFRLSLTQAGKPLAVDEIRVVKLAQRHDYEDVAPCPPTVAESIRRQRNPVEGLPRGEAAEAVLVCEEDTPAIRAFSLADGAMLGAVSLPDNLRAIRRNRGLESLAIEPDGRSVWTANEEALVDDGPPSAEGSGTVVRLTRLPLPGAAGAGAPAADPALAPVFQAAYPVDPPHAFVRVLAGPPLSGLSALVALGKGRLLALERSGGPGLPPFNSRLYLVDTAAAVDVSAVEQGLSGRRETFVEKRLLWKDSLGINLEGICLGPRLADGNRALVAIADNGGLGTPTQLIGLKLVVPAPAIQPAVLGTVAALLAIALVVGRLTSP